MALLGWSVAPPPLDAAAGAAADSPPRYTIECVEDARTLCLWQYAPAASTAPLVATTLPAPPSFGLRPRVLATVPASSAPFGMRGTDAAARTEVDGDDDEGGGSGGAPSLPPLDAVGEHRVWSMWLVVTAGDTAPAWMRCISLLLPRAAAPSARDEALSGVLQLK